MLKGLSKQRVLTMSRVFVFLFLLGASPAWAGLDFVSITERKPFLQTIAAPCSELLKIKPLKAEQVEHIIGDGNDGSKVGRAIAYLKSLHGASQLELVTLWEQIAKFIIYESEEGWDCYRFTSHGGAVGYRGTAAHAVVFTKSGKIYKGMVPDEQISEGNIWNSDFSGLREVK
jgi:hypothetical protein